MAKSAPKKIALLLSCLKFGGGERVALNLAKALKDTGVQVDILLMSKEGEFLAEAEKHFNVVDLECNKTYKLPGKLLVYLAKQRPNVLVSSFWKLNLCSCLAKMLYPGFKLILWEHSPPSRSKNSPTWLYAITATIFYQWSNKVVTVSTGVFKDIDRWTLGLRRKLVVIFNPIIPPNPDFAIQTVSKYSDRKTIISVGRLDDPKNPNLLLEAFALVPEECNAVLLFVGDGRLRRELEQRCRALGIEESVKFLGYRSNPYEMMAIADLLVVSSDREGLPSVIIEAMYCGLRIVSTDCGEGVHDILLDNHYGTIVPSGDKFALAKAMETELAIQYSKQDQENGAERFLPRTIVQQFLAIM